MGMPSGRAVVAAQRVRGSLPRVVSDFSMEQVVSKLEALVLLGRVLCPPLGQRVFPKLPLCLLGTSQQELTKVLIGAGISTR